MHNIDTITHAALDALAWATADLDSDPSMEDHDPSFKYCEHLDGYGYEWNPDSVAFMRDRVAAFMETAAPILDRLANLGFTLYADDLARIGHDYTLTCERHGAGFWDRRMEAGTAPGSPLGCQIQDELDKLTDICHDDGGLECYADHDTENLRLLNA